MASVASAVRVLSGVRNAIWVLKGGWWLVRFLRPAEPPIFGHWRFYDETPGDGNAVGVAELKRVGPRNRVEMIGLRSKSTTDGQDTEHVYRYKGYLRDRKLVLTWVAEDRPDTFGTLVLALNEACSEMMGYSTFVPISAGQTVSKPIYFRRK
jgi:hypothetical protein